MSPGSITPAALMVTATLCLVTAVVAIGVVTDFVRTSELDSDGAQLLLALVAATGTLLARTFRDLPPEDGDGRARRELHRADGTSTLEPPGPMAEGYEPPSGALRPS